MPDYDEEFDELSEDELEEEELLEEELWAEELEELGVREDDYLGQITGIPSPGYEVEE